MTAAPPKSKSRAARSHHFAPGSFGDWLSNYNRDNRIGDLRDEMRTDRNFPADVTTWDALHSYLLFRRAHYEAIAAARRAFKSYRRTIVKQTQVPHLDTPKQPHTGGQ